jgi:hypothetical protein
LNAGCCKPNTCMQLSQVLVDGVIFRVGDAAYVVLDPTKYTAFCEFPDEENGEVTPGACHACGHEEQADSTLIECDYCMREYHLACVASDVDDGDFWKCSHCISGRRRWRQYQQTKAQAFVQLPDTVGLARIKAIWQEGSSKLFNAQWFYRPSDTVHGMPLQTAQGLQLLGLH